MTLYFDVGPSPGNFGAVFDGSSRVQAGRVRHMVTMAIIGVRGLLRIMADLCNEERMHRHFNAGMR